MHLQQCLVQATEQLPDRGRRPTRQAYHRVHCDERRLRQEVRRQAIRRQVPRPDDQGHSPEDVQVNPQRCRRALRLLSRSGPLLQALPLPVPSGGGRQGTTPYEVRVLRGQRRRDQVSFAPRLRRYLFVCLRYRTIQVGHDQEALCYRPALQRPHLSAGVHRPGRHGDEAARQEAAGHPQE